MEFSFFSLVTIISTDPLSQIYKMAKAVVTVSLEHVVVAFYTSTYFRLTDSTDPLID
jgi:hypothetical protein